MEAETEKYKMYLQANRNTGQTLSPLFMFCQFPTLNCISAVVANDTSLSTAETPVSRQLRLSQPGGPRLSVYQQISRPIKYRLSAFA